MIVRVYDRDDDSYFISEVYGIINMGYYERYLVIDKRNNIPILRLIDFLDKNNKIEQGMLSVNINVISNNFFSIEWIVKKQEELVDIQEDTIDKEKDIFYFRGYSFIYQNKEVLMRLMNKNAISINKFIGFKEVCTEYDDWNYIYTENDIRHIMEEFERFEDAVLVSANYISGAGRMNGGICAEDYIRQVEMIFDNMCNKSIRIVFEGVLSFNLYPAEDNYCSDIYQATILRHKETIYFYTQEVKEIDEQNTGTWINSLGMRWKFI